MNNVTPTIGGVSPSSSEPVDPACAALTGYLHRVIPGIEYVNGFQVVEIGLGKLLKLIPHLVRQHAGAKERLIAIASTVGGNTYTSDEAHDLYEKLLIEICQVAKESPELLNTSAEDPALQEQMQTLRDITDGRSASLIEKGLLKAAYISARTLTENDQQQIYFRIWEVLIALECYGKAFEISRLLDSDFKLYHVVRIFAQRGRLQEAAAVAVRTSGKTIHNGHSGTPTVLYDARLELYEAYIKKPDYDMALNFALKLEDRVKKSEALGELVEQNIDFGDLETAVELFNKIPIDGLRDHPLIPIVLAHFERGNFEEALKFTKMIKFGGIQYKVITYMVEHCFHVGAYDQALQVAELNTSDIVKDDLLAMIVCRMLKDNKVEEALVYARSINNEKERESALLSIIAKFVESGEKSGAQEIFEELKRGIVKAKALSLLGDVSAARSMALGIKEFTERIEALCSIGMHTEAQNMIVQNPHESRGKYSEYHMLAYALTRNFYAVDKYHNPYIYYPEAALGILVLVEKLIELDQFEIAIDVANEYEYYSSLGIIACEYAKQQKFDEAIEYFERIREDSVESYFPGIVLVGSLVEAGMLERALPLIDTKEQFDTLLESVLVRGNIEELKRVADLVPNYVVSRFLVGKLVQKLRELSCHEEARAAIAWFKNRSHHAIWVKNNIIE